VSDKYKIANPDGAYFLTLTVVGWIDAFTRKNHKMIIVESLKYCQQNKGLVIFGWCLMPSHMHLIARAEGEATMSEISRDFKKFTARKIIAQIQGEPESRREWMLSYFEHAEKHLKRIEKFKFWQDGNQAKEIYSKEFFYEKLAYIHNNPVEEMIVSKPEEYVFSSARNYTDLSVLLEIVMESSRQVPYI
jgi:putative transposase